jgi:hypothetical protein
MEDLAEADKVVIVLPGLPGSVDDAILGAIQLSNFVIAIRSAAERAFFKA